MGVGRSSTYVNYLSCAGRPSLHARIRAVSEIPNLVIHADPGDFGRRERDFVVSPDLDDAAFAHDGLIEASAVLEFHGDYLIPNARLRCLPQMREAFLGNGKQALHH